MNQYIITEEELNRACDQMTAVGYGVSANYIDSKVRSRPYQSERAKVLDEVNAILSVRKMYMEELFDELRDPAVAKHSLQQIEIIRFKVNDLRDMRAGEP
jgi:hypothetical protein